MNELLRRAEAVADEADSVSMAALVDGVFPRPLEVAGLKSEDIRTIWAGVRAETCPVRNRRRGVPAGICMRRGGDSVTLTGHAEVVGDAAVRRSVLREMFAADGGEVNDRKYRLLRFRAEKASLWIDGSSAHFDLYENE